MTPDPTIEVVHAAIGFATAAVHGDHALGHRLARHALELEPDGFLDAVMTTIEAIADEAQQAGADTATHLRELGLGIHLAALDEQREPDDRTLRPPHP
jgi:hypothetical protein